MATGMLCGAWVLAYMLVTFLMLRRLLWHMDSHGLLYNRTVPVPDPDDKGFSKIFYRLEGHVHGEWGHPDVGKLLHTYCRNVNYYLV